MDLDELTSTVCNCRLGLIAKKLTEDDPIAVYITGLARPAYDAHSYVDLKHCFDVHWLKQLM